MVPEDLRYTTGHEWVQLTDSGNVRFGITHHAQNSLGDIVFVTLPDVGASLNAGDSCGEIESTKSVADVYAPIDGVVSARNDVVETSPETINADPYGGGWLVEIAPTKADQLDGLIDATAYSALIAGE